MDASTSGKQHGLIDVLLREGDLGDLVQEASATLTHVQLAAGSDSDFLLYRLRQRCEEFLYLLDKEIRQQTTISPSYTNPKEETLSVCPSTTREVASDLPIPLEVLILTADSGFLNNQEIGRLLLLSSRTIKDQVGSSFTWNCLCGSKFPLLLQSQALRPRTIFSAEWIFREFSTVLAQRDSTSVPWPPLSPPKLHIEDLIIVMQWYNSKTDSNPHTTLEWTSEQTMEFLQDGQVTIPIPNDDPTVATSHQTPWTVNIKKLQYVYVKVHCVRKDTRQCCCIHETGEYTWDVAPHTRAIHRALSVGHLFLGPKVPILLENSGKDLETRLARADRDPGGFELLVIAKASQRWPSNKDSPTTQTSCLEIPASSSSTVSESSNDFWQVKEVTFQWWANYSDQIFVYESLGQSRKHGVTMLHILDELEGWK